MAKKSNFSGFSEADILKLQNDNTNKTTQEKSVTTKNYPPANLTKSNKSTKQDSKNKIILENKLNTSQSTPLPSEARLVPTNPNPQIMDHTAPTTIINKSEPTKDENNQNEIPPPSENPQRKPINFEEMKMKQKYMEEQNRIRKQQIARALADRTKRSLQEQQKLTEIQDEFKKLDDMLSKDVKLLRKQIELASYDYMEATKRYHRKEKEFLEAKLQAQMRLEKKELLTEHLSAIVGMNESRKADKLNELLQKLATLDKEAKLQDSKVASDLQNDAK